MHCFCEWNKMKKLWGVRRYMSLNYCNHTLNNFLMCNYSGGFRNEILDIYSRKKNGENILGIPLNEQQLRKKQIHECCIMKGLQTIGKRFVCVWTRMKEFLPQKTGFEENFKWRNLVCNKTHWIVENIMWLAAIIHLLTTPYLKVFIENHPMRTSKFPIFPMKSFKSNIPSLNSY